MADRPQLKWLSSAMAVGDVHQKRDTTVLALAGSTEFLATGYLGLMGGDPGLSYDEVIAAEGARLEQELEDNPDIGDPDVELFGSSRTHSRPTAWKTPCNDCSATAGGTRIYAAASTV
jgi:hypothetical protein